MLHSHGIRQAVDGRQHFCPKLKYLNFLPFSTMEFTTGCYVNPQMPHARRKHDPSLQWEGDLFGAIITVFATACKPAETSNKNQTHGNQSALN